MDYKKERLYKILQNLYSKTSIEFKTEDFFNNLINDNEIKELINLLTNNNPFFQTHPSFVQFKNVINNDQKALGSYDFGQDRISYSIQFVEGVIKNPTHVGMLFDTIYHEQQHHNQDIIGKSNNAIVDGIDMSEIYHSMFEKRLTNEDLAELHRFATKHNLIKLNLSQAKMIELQLGAYYANKAEIDARKVAFDNTIATFDAMINDPECPSKLKRHLKSSLRQYKSFQKENSANIKFSMNDFNRLEKRIKKVLFKAIRSDKDLDNETYNQLLNGILSYITQHLTLEENLEIAGWAIKNNYIPLINQINISKSKSGHQKDINNFLNKISSKGLVTSANFKPIAKLFAPMKQEKQEKALSYLADLQADMRKPLILLDNLLFDEDCSFITPAQIDVAVRNYINYAQATGKIDNDFEELRYKMSVLIYHTDLLHDKEKEHFEKLYNRLLKLNTITPQAELSN